MEPLSVYLHIPFCKHRCGYCDFNTYAGLDNLIPNYTRALRIEIETLVSSLATRPRIHSIYFGGGTPSLLSVDQLEKILVILKTSFDSLPNVEVTLEANPGTLSPDYLRELRRLGINRLSLGMQSAHPEELNLLEREHSYPDVIRSMAWARKAGFENLNLDLIFALPGQTLESWQRSLRLALGLQPEHFSIYALTLEQGTPLASWAARGLLTEPDPDLAAEMYEWASEQLDRYDYAQYEISNWAFIKRNDRKVKGETLACRHNLQYWRNLPYLGFGAGAHGYAKRIRTANVLSPPVYIQRLLEQPPPTPRLNFPLTPATKTAHEIDRATEISETMLMGLRLTQEGISTRAFQKRFDQEILAVYGSKIERLISLGLLEWANAQSTLRLTQKGRLLANQVFMQFV